MFENEYTRTSKTPRKMPAKPHAKTPSARDRAMMELFGHADPMLDNWLAWAREHEVQFAMMMQALIARR